jgi:hypothetical protein
MRKKRVSELKRKANERRGIGWRGRIRRRDAVALWLVGNGLQNSEGKKEGVGEHGTTLLLMVDLHTEDSDEKKRKSRKTTGAMMKKKT